MAMLLVLALLIAVLVGGLIVYTARVARQAEKAVPAIGRFIDVPGARLHFVERGQGDAVLLVHGLGGQLNNFNHGVIDLLATKYRVVAVDRPGSGYSTRPPGAAATLSAQADVLAALIEALKLHRPLVVGHSLGGAIALALAQRHPERVAGLALVAPATQLVDVPAVFKGLVIPSPWLRKLIAWTMATPLGVLKGEEILRQVFAPEPAPADFPIRGGGALSLRPSHFIATSADLVAVPEEMPSVTRQYGSMRLPVSILFGRSDEILDPKVHGAALAAQLPGAELTWVEGGHMLPITAPERTAQFISDAFDQTTTTTKVDA